MTRARRYARVPQRDARKVHARRRQLQEITVPGATKQRDEWTERDVEVLADSAKTDLEKALILHRTYYSVTAARRARKLKSSALRLSDLETAQWFVKRRDELVT